MASMSRFLTQKLRLTVNEAKSAVARPEERKFLGFSISNDGSERRIAPKALDKFKTQVRDRTRRTRGISLQQLIEDLTPYLIGWRGYFGFCQTPRVLTNLEAWIRRRLRSYLWRQWQNGHNRFNELRRRGVPKFNAAVAAGSPTGFWRMSGHPAVQQALRNHYFDSLGLPQLPRLYPSLTQSNRRRTDPYARWWGRGGIARCPPIPIFGGNSAINPRSVERVLLAEKQPLVASLVPRHRWRLRERNQSSRGSFRLNDREPPQHVFKHPRNVIVVVVVRKAAAEGN